MDTSAPPIQPSRKAGLAGSLFHYRGVVLTLVLPVLCILPFFLFYQEENWRGKRAWDNVKREARAKGHELDWNASMPPPVPGNQNFFSVPEMQSWFVGRGFSPLSRRLDFNNFATSLPPRGDCIVAEVTIVPPTALVTPDEADVVLRYSLPHLTLSMGPDAVSKTTESETPIPLIVMDEVPLTDAIKNLARQANIKYTLDPKINYGQTDPNGVVHLQPTVSVRWTNLTATAALNAVLSNYQLVMVRDPNSDVARIVAMNDAVRKPPVLEVELAKMIGDALSAALEHSNSIEATSPQLTASLGFGLAAQPMNTIKPLRVVVRSDTMPTANEVKDFFPQHSLGNNPSVISRLEAKASGSNTFQVYLNPPPVVVAADYLAWSDQFRADFDKIHDALQRPYALMLGDYTDPTNIPIPNFTAVRVLAQTLSSRAQCYLLMNQPENALRELTLLHEMSRLLEGRPTSKPQTLIAAMINVAITGLYVNAVGDGLRLKVWREPQLMTLQKQLAEINLPQFVAFGIEWEASSFGRIIETKTPEEIAGMFDQRQTLSPVDKAKDPLRWILTFVPQGWVYQNAAFAGRMYGKLLDGFDTSNHLVFAKKVDASGRQIELELGHFTPSTFLARFYIPNFSHAVQTMAQYQTMANEAYLACALERHRLANGNYPQTLAALTPRFAEKIPTDLFGGQPLKYRATNGQFTLYSIGWNETDEGGIPAYKKDGTGDRAKNDWVWPTE